MRGELGEERAYKLLPHPSLVHQVTGDPRSTSPDGKVPASPMLFNEVLSNDYGQVTSALS